MVTGFRNIARATRFQRPEPRAFFGVSGRLSLAIGVPSVRASDGTDVPDRWTAERPTFLASQVRSPTRTLT